MLVKTPLFYTDLRLQKARQNRIELVTRLGRDLPRKPVRPPGLATTGFDASETTCPTPASPKITSSVNEMLY